MTSTRLSNTLLMSESALGECNYRKVTQGMDSVETSNRIVRNDAPDQRTADGIIQSEKLLSRTSLEQRKETNVEIYHASKNLDSPRKVHFSKRKKMVLVPHISNIPMEIRNAVWYSPSEFACMRRSYMQTVRLMMRGFADIMPDQYHCTRGLEGKTREGARRRHNVKATAMITVLQEQERFRSMQSGCIGRDEYNEYLSQLYQEAGSSDCHIWAVVQGLKDEQEVKDYLCGSEIDLVSSDNFSTGNRVSGRSFNESSGVIFENAPYVGNAGVA